MCSPLSPPLYRGSGTVTIRVYVYNMLLKACNATISLYTYWETQGEEEREVLWLPRPETYDIAVRTVFIVRSPAAASLTRSSLAFGVCDVEGAHIRESNSSAREICEKRVLSGLAVRRRARSCIATQLHSPSAMTASAKPFSCSPANEFFFFYTRPERASNSGCLV